MIFSIDIDSINIKRLLKTLKKALDLGLKVLGVRISPSRRGFHVLLKKDELGVEELIKYRALLDDDPYRLRYSLKRWALGGEVDVCFERKAGKDAIPIQIDLDELKEIDVLEVDKLVEKYKKKFGNLLRKSFLTIFEIQDKNLEHVKEVLGDIAERDSSFRYKIYPNLYKKRKTKFIGVVFNKDLNEAHRRGTWLTKNVSGINSYWIKELERKI